ncbi:MAG: tetratricopeptide repeat protein [Planctomycetota bacterium]
MNESTSSTIGTTTTKSTFKTLDKYKGIIGIGVGVAIAIGVGVTFLVSSKSRSTDEAWQGVSKVNGDLVASVRQHAKDETSRNAALSKAAEAYKSLKAANPSPGVMPWILFQLGNISYSLKNYDDAIREYNAFLDSYSGHPLTPIIRQSLGYAYEEKGLFPEAIKQFEGASTANSSLLAQEGWDSGRCYEKTGQTNEAIRLYTRTVELSPNSNWAAMAQYRLSLIR